MCLCKYVSMHMLIWKSRKLTIGSDGNWETLIEQVKGCAVHHEQDNTGQQSNAGQPYLPIESLDSEHIHYSYLVSLN